VHVRLPRSNPWGSVYYLYTDCIQRLLVTSQGNRFAGLFLAHTALQERIPSTSAALACLKQWSRDVRSVCRLLPVKATCCEQYLLVLASGQLEGESGRLQLLRDCAYVLLPTHKFEFCFSCSSEVEHIMVRGGIYLCYEMDTHRSGDTTARRTHCIALVYSWSPRPLFVTMAQDPY
jgi:hypothetical protein